jgi:DNA-directed RNA polymerase specialized sigma24 family protein
MGHAGGVTVEFHLFDAEYVRKLTGGDAATESHFSAYFGKFILAKMRARRISAEMAEDICQETLLRVLKSLRQGPGVTQPERFGGFVNAVSNNVLLEFVHKESRHQEALDELPAKDREILRMVFFEEADRERIAEAFEVDTDYLRVLLHRAKSRFYAAYVRKDRGARRFVALLILCNVAALKLTIE